MALIQETLREIVRFSKEDEEEFVRIVKAEAENQQSSAIKGQKTRLAACKKRLDELETLICKIYEDNALGKLPDKRYQILDAQYAKEQESLEAEAASLQKAVDEYESGQKSADKFIALVKKYQNFEKLDTVMLNEFIYKIFVHERDYKGVANSPQTIESTSISSESLVHKKSISRPKKNVLKLPKKSVCVKSGMKPTFAVRPMDGRMLLPEA